MYYNTVVYYNTVLYFFLLWRCGPTGVMASSFLRFLDHTQRRTTVGRTPLDEWSARRRDLWQHTTLTTDKHPWPRWDSKSRSQHTVLYYNTILCYNTVLYYNNISLCISSLALSSSSQPSTSFLARSCPSNAPAHIRRYRTSHEAHFACNSPNTRLTASGILFPDTCWKRFHRRSCLCLQCWIWGEETMQVKN